VIDRAKVQAEARLDGKYLLRTSDDTLTPADVALGYKQLVEVEEAFRTLKHTLELRPIYHRRDDRIRAHVLLCWLALLLVRVAEMRVEQGLGQPYSWDRIRIELQRMHLGTFRGQAGLLPHRPRPGPRGVDTRVCLPSMPEKPVIAGPWPLLCRSQLSNSGRSTRAHVGTGCRWAWAGSQGRGQPGRERGPCR
jgi:hypothetical protein